MPDMRAYRERTWRVWIVILGVLGRGWSEPHNSSEGRTVACHGAQDSAVRSRLPNRFQRNAMAELEGARAEIMGTTEAMTDEELPHSSPETKSGPVQASKVVLSAGGKLFCGERRSGGIDFPGGKAQLGEEKCECAVRELMEEVEFPTTALRDEVSRRIFASSTVTFLFETDDDRSYMTTLFLVETAMEGISLTEDGHRELSDPGWRSLDEVLADLNCSRRPPQAGRAYAEAVVELLSYSGSESLKKRP
jgi:8-oxo-dGTP pyrophosphatase MutT (NUDIX family)